MDSDIIKPEETVKCVKEIIPPIKTCLTDDYAPDLRFAACNMVEKLFVHLRTIISDDELRDIYPALLERLDDS